MIRTIAHLVICFVACLGAVGWAAGYAWLGYVLLIPMTAAAAVDTFVTERRTYGYTPLRLSDQHQEQDTSLGADLLQAP